METTSGLVDSHSHLRATSLEEQGVVGSCLEEALLRMNAMTNIDPYDSALVASSDLLLKGITAVQMIFHTFGSPDHYLQTLEKTIAGLVESGIRARVVLAITDQYEFATEFSNSNIQFPSFIDVGQRMSPRNFAEIVQEAQRRFASIDLGVGPVAPQWCSDAMMETIGEIADSGLRIHTHFLESAHQRNWIGEDPLRRLQRFGLLNQNCSLAHAIWVTDEELEQIRESGAQLVTCPRSNKYLRAGRAHVDRWLDKGIPFGIGLDSVGGEETAIGVARLSLDESDALKALTRGGTLSTGLPTESDRVTWQNWDLGIVETVSINGVSIVETGALRNEDEIKEIRARIAFALSSDAQARNIRHKQIDDIIPEFLREFV